MVLQPAARRPMVPVAMAAATMTGFWKRPRLASQTTSPAARRTPPEIKSQWIERGSRRRWKGGRRVGGVGAGAWGGGRGRGGGGGVAAGWQLEQYALPSACRGRPHWAQ